MPRKQSAGWESEAGQGQPIPEARWSCLCSVSQGLLQNAHNRSQNSLRGKEDTIYSSPFDVGLPWGVHAPQLPRHPGKGLGQDELGGGARGPQARPRLVVPSTKRSKPCGELVTLGPGVEG